jgi:hypothetical protein
MLKNIRIIIKFIRKNGGKIGINIILIIVNLKIIRLN